MSQPPKTPDLPEDLPEKPFADATIPPPPPPPPPPAAPAAPAASSGEGDEWKPGPAHPAPPVAPPHVSTPPVPPVPPAAGAAGAVGAAGAAAAAAGMGTPATPPPPLTPPGPPLNPAGGGSTYGRGANRMNLLGYLSLIFGIIGTGCCCCPWLNGAPFVGGIPAIVLGIMHLMRVKKGQASQKWLGWVGIILGVLALVGGIVELTTNVDTRITDEYNQQFGDM